MDKLNAIGKQFAAIWKRISLNQRISIVLVAVMALLGLWMFAKLSSRPSMTRLYPSALDPEDASAIADKLRDENVTFQVRDGGRAIYVPSGRVDDLRLTMASAGLPANAGGTGWGDLFDKGGLGGDSQSMLDIKRLRALQGELARTISSLSSVQSARVHLVIPPKPLFKLDEKPATASVVLGLRPGTQLGAGEISGIKYLCSSAVEGLKVNNITILDGDGNVLAKPTQEGSMADMTEGQVALARSIEKDYLSKVRAQLDPACGPGNWSAAFTVELNSESQQTEKVVATTGPTTKEQLTERSTDRSKAYPGGEAGTGSNIGSSTISSETGDRSTEKESTTLIETEPNRTKTTTVSPAGTIKRVSASVVINKDRGEGAENATTLGVKDVEDLVKSVIAYSQVRGDQVSVHEASFVPAATDTAQVASMPNPIVTGVAKHGPAAIVSIALLGFLWVFMKKTSFAEPRTESGPTRVVGVAPSSGSHSERPLPDAVASDKRVQEIFTEIVLEESEAELRGMREAMAHLADQKPESIAAVIREWIS
ncbi:MAG: flagellar M-ring protein FliF [Verrucomicrobia bacterium]|nr:flagellar M-ring protein FliF [Verrucomicrobiota bacterium]